MNNNFGKFDGPVAIGGVGGSGTRVVTRILIELGYYMGSNVISRSLDNNHFRFLFTFSRLLKKNKDNRRKILRACSVFHKGYGSASYRLAERLLVLECAIKQIFSALNIRGLTGKNKVDRRKNVRKVFAKMKYLYGKDRKDSPKQMTGWGWKAPTTHIFLEYLIDYFGEFKYIHVVRHGLDMAFASLLHQLYSWGDYFDVAQPDSDDVLPHALLDYWIKSNQRAIEVDQRRLGDRFMVLNFDRLCLSPRTEIPRLVTFLGLDPAQVDIEKLCALVKVPESMGRYKKHLAIFSDEEIAAVKRLGFTVEAE